MDTRWFTIAISRAPIKSFDTSRCFFAVPLASKHLYFHYTISIVFYRLLKLYLLGKKKKKFRICNHSALSRTQLHLKYFSMSPQKRITSITTLRSRFRRQRAMKFNEGRDTSKIYSMVIETAFSIVFEASSIHLAGVFLPHTFKLDAWANISSLTLLCNKFLRNVASFYARARVERDPKKRLTLRWPLPI